MLNIRKSEGEVFVNSRVEHFPGYMKIAVADYPIFKDPAWEGEKVERLPAKLPDPSRPPEERSVNRAKKKVHDIAALNDFDYFITWTLDDRKIARCDPSTVSKKLKIFLSNKVKRNEMSYVIVPELHSDGKAIHMHGLISGDFQLEASGLFTPDKRSIYNMPDWKYGFSTCIELNGDREKAANYISKYISKEFRKLFGNFYYAGGNVKRWPPTSYTNLDYDSIDAKPYRVPNSNVSIKYLTIREGA